MIERPTEPTSDEADRPKVEGLSLQPEQSRDAPLTGLVQADEERALTGLTEARHRVEEADHKKELDQLIGSLNFADPYNYKAFIADSYHATASTGSQNTRIEGLGYEAGAETRPNGRWANRGVSRPHYQNPDNGEELWGNLGEEAHASGHAVERAGVRAEKVVEAEGIPGKVKADGLKGKLGLRKKGMVGTQYHDTDELKYFFDYGFASPARVTADEDDRAAGNHAGQNIRLTVGITEEQARGLSDILKEDPTAARAVLDTFVAQTGDKGKWEAEIFDEEGSFHDPGKRYGTETFVARDVRPNYDAVPDLQPEIVGLVTPDGPDAQPQTELRRLAS